MPVTQPPALAPKPGAPAATSNRGPKKTATSAAVTPIVGHEVKAVAAAALPSAPVIAPTPIEVKIIQQQQPKRNGHEKQQQQTPEPLLAHNAVPLAINRGQFYTEPIQFMAELGKLASVFGTSFESTKTKEGRTLDKALAHFAKTAQSQATMPPAPGMPVAPTSPDMKRDVPPGSAATAETTTSPPSAAPFTKLEDWVIAAKALFASTEHDPIPFPSSVARNPSGSKQVEAIVPVQVMPPTTAAEATKLAHQDHVVGIPGACLVPQILHDAVRETTKDGSLKDSATLLVTSVEMDAVAISINDDKQPKSTGCLVGMNGTLLLDHKDALLCEDSAEGRAFWSSLNDNLQPDSEVVTTRRAAILRPMSGPYASKLKRPTFHSSFLQDAYRTIQADAGMQRLFDAALSMDLHRHIEDSVAQLPEEKEDAAFLRTVKHAVKITGSADAFEYLVVQYAWPEAAYKMLASSSSPADTNQNRLILCMAKLIKVTKDGSVWICFPGDSLTRSLGKLADICSGFGTKLTVRMSDCTVSPLFQAYVARTNRSNYVVRMTLTYEPVESGSK